ncbi:hypothetical protein GN330_08435 [Nitratireductor sp. CAU 1489]|uniref:4Fe-4S ferredoxin-type domain-containing protein n=1 Tax=Nitratireductor arenosus TaxID=2682096 RepID=A0A844QGX2_9HYPH|nr:hypothetical protein [Nitratireductor arenosus]MVA97273.1 hypothetical protein [Nitratireductor arenosus]
MAAATMPENLADALAAHGLMARGGFVFDDDEAAPAGPSGAAAGAVVLVGHAGSTIWPHFSRWLADQPANLADPLDCWSRETIGAIAGRFTARAVFPFEKPFLPFQRWAMRAEGLKPSPLGILIHPEYGLWHAYRGALLFETQVAEARPHALSHACDACAEKPCLFVCPADAVSSVRHDHAACLAHLRSGRGGACMGGGCLARLACPVGAGWRYDDAQQTFHMRTFAGAPVDR